MINASQCRTAVIGKAADGQSMLRDSQAKRYFPERNKANLVISGGFHAFGHFLMVANEGHHKSSGAHSKAVLHKEKVPEHIKDFEGDSYRHMLTHVMEESIGIVTWLVIDVVAPPPSLLLDDPQAYEAQIKRANA